MRREAPPLLRLWPRATLIDGTLSLGRVPDLLLVSFIVLALPWLSSIAVLPVAPLAARMDSFDYWLKPTAHQLGALVLTLLLMRAFSVRSWADWGFNLRRFGASLGMAGIFAVITTPALYVLMERQPMPTTPISTSQIVAVLLTHFLVIGFTQEVLFRAFAMGMLQQHWRRAAGLIAALLFMLAHVKFSPPYFWPPQLVLSFLFGCLYALMYSRTGSLLGPSLAHGFSNTIFVAMLMLEHLREPPP
jgi:membrane protease YdiL (CAAX protease family)